MMPGPRRIPRNMRSSSVSPPVISSFNNEICGQRYAPLGSSVPMLPALEQPAAPKHFPFPNIMSDNELVFEFLISVFSICAGGLQLLHLYRTVWWLPHSYTNQAVSFYMIDIHLIVFIVLILSRRLLYLLGNKVLSLIFDENKQRTYKFYYRLILFCGMSFILAICTYYVMQNHQFEKILYLCYPFIIYVILFGFNVQPFFELVKWASNRMPPLHACSTKPVEIRKEVENLISNFNYRIKEILFSSILNAYYAGFIPCCFAQSVVHYDILWAIQYILFIFISSFLAFSFHVLSLRYCDILHRSALHLGIWEKLETNRTILLVNNIWQEDILWPFGALVRYGRDIWRAQGDCNASEPGNVGLRRFYSIFKNPTSGLGLILLIHFLMVLYQLFLLVRCTVWYIIISLTFLLFFNYFILYKLCRDYLVSYKIYMEEREMHNKINM